MLKKPRCFVEDECADEVINKSTDSGDGTFDGYRKYFSVITTLLSFSMW